MKLRYIPADSNHVHVPWALVRSHTITDVSLLCLIFGRLMAVFPQKNILKCGLVYPEHVHNVLLSLWDELLSLPPSGYISGCNSSLSDKCLSKELSSSPNLGVAALHAETNKFAAYFNSYFMYLFWTFFLNRPAVTMAILQNTINFVSTLIFNWVSVQDSWSTYPSCSSGWAVPACHQDNVFSPQYADMESQCSKVGFGVLPKDSLTSGVRKKKNHWLFFG